MPKKKKKSLDAASELAVRKAVEARLKPLRGLRERLFNMVEEITDLSFVAGEEEDGPIHTLHSQLLEWEADFEKALGPKPAAKRPRR